MAEIYSNVSGAVSGLRGKEDDNIVDQDQSDASSGGDDDAENDDDENEEDDEEDYEEEEPEQPYSVEEIASTIKDLYEFLATLHYSPKDLKLPPEGGWQTIPGLSEGLKEKSNLVKDVLQHLPYFADSTPAQLHYKSRIRDYSSCQVTEKEAFYERSYWEELLPHMWDFNVNVDDILILAAGHESGGRTFALIPKTGEIIEDIVRCDTLSPRDLVEVVNELKDQHRQLQLIGGVARNVIEADRVSEVGSEEPAEQEDGTDWETHKNVNLVRQIYRKYGWPENFKRDEANAEITEWMAQRDMQGLDTWQCDTML